jgi:hypothetical protein
MFSKLRAEKSDRAEPTPRDAMRKNFTVLKVRGDEIASPA